MNIPDDIVEIAKDKASRIDYGDWQTSVEFAKSVCVYLKDNGMRPEVLIEPTCGVGNFIAAAVEVFGSIKAVYGIEINKEYIDETERKLKGYVQCGLIETYALHTTNIFHFDFREIIAANHNKNILVLGNPPWVTNSGLGKTDGTNLPTKGNIKKAKGIDAITGKGNFDIAESVCYKIMEAFAGEGHTQIALLVKNSVVRNIVYRQHTNPLYVAGMRQLNFDAKKEFNVSVAASLFHCVISREHEHVCEVLDFYTRKKSHSFGWVENAFTSNVDEYNETKMLDGESQLVWRSGIKHDCSKVMELSYMDGQYINGLNEVVDIESSSIFPLLKSSDIGKGYKGIRKYLVLPQRSISEDTSKLKAQRPKTYSYLVSHADLLDSRKSSIYKNKPRFCVFGLGEYSFSPYKIVISSLYKDLQFSLIAPIGDCPVMVDDTCYLLGFDNMEYAKITLYLLQAPRTQKFIRNICFEDAKRIVSRDLLMRINLYQLAMSSDVPKSIGVDETVFYGYKNWLSTLFIPSLF